jgi:hypothetical protein
MPIPLEKILVVEDEIERLNHDDKDKKIHRPTTTITRPEQDFSFLNKPQTKRSVHYDIEPIDNQEYQPLRQMGTTEQPSIDNVLRRRYIAHWGLPGKQLSNKKKQTNDVFQ